jgi:sarcosine oxidase
METIRARNLVLGAGAMGCATTYHLAKAGEEVLLVEQFDTLHNKGSSHGVARITRHSYADLAYAKLMVPAFTAWRELEADFGRTLYLKTGGISLCPKQVEYVSQVVESLKALGVPHRRMTAEQLHRACPPFEVPGGTDAVFEPDAGVLLAETALGAELTLARELGGDKTRIMDNCLVERLDLEADRPTLICSDCRIEADFLIVTAGAWVTRLLPEWSRGLVVTRQQVAYFRPAVASAFEIGRFPVFVYKGAPDEASFYGLPRVWESWVKVARHSGPEFDPARPDRPFDDDYPDVVRHFLRWHLPSLAEAELVDREVCLYTEEAGENFRVGLHPARPDVLVASPCSGHGFKFSPLVGRVLCELATRGEASVDISAWAWRG